MLAFFLLEYTSGPAVTRPNVSLMTRATQKEQAATMLETNLLNVNHFEYKQDFKKDL